MEENIKSDEVGTFNRSPRNTPSKNADATARSIMSVSRKEKNYPGETVQSRVTEPTSPVTKSRMASLRVCRQPPTRRRLVASQIPTITAAMRNIHSHSVISLARRCAQTCASKSMMAIKAK